MIDELTEECRLDDGSRLIEPIPYQPNQFFVAGAKSFSFALCRKPCRFGELKFDQYWMDTRSVYAAKPSRARNRDVVIEYFWSLCWKHGTVVHDSIQDSYLLAKLFPYVRSKGTRRVFCDAVLPNASRGEKRAHRIAELDDLLCRSRSEEKDLEGFHQGVANLIGPARLDPLILQKYEQMAQELLGDARRAMQRDGEAAGLQVALKKWQQWMQGLARHRGNARDKQVLDILSYESRAALHRCYSATWSDLLPYLANKYAMSDEAYAFHRLWHFELSLPSNSAESWFHLFHGHVFGLHPAGSLFIQTQTGCELMAEWLADPGTGHPFRRLLHGLLVAIGAYALHYDSQRQQRK